MGLFIAEQGKEVLIFEMMDTVMTGIAPDEKQVYENRMGKCKVSFHTGQRLESVSDKTITLVDRYGARTEVSVDTIVLASGFRPNRDLIDRLQAEPALRVVEAGDCVRPRKIHDAIYEGHLAAKLLN